MTCWQYRRFEMKYIFNNRTMKCIKETLQNFNILQVSMQFSIMMLSLVLLTL